MPEVKEFKCTCLGCGNVTFKPYVDFEAMQKAEASEGIVAKGAKKAADGAIIGGLSMACLPLGCCAAIDTAQHAALKKKPIDERIKHYCDAFMCKKCKSMAIKIEVITHNV